VTEGTSPCPWLAEILAGAMARKRFRFRPPGLKPTTKIGTLGPYRARLGLAWVIAPIVAGAVIVIAGYLVLAR
jgi:H+/gluconate symporter-like permease